MTDHSRVRFARNPDMIWTGVDGQTVMLSIDRGEYFGLGGVGGRVWEVLAEPVTADEICERLISEFDVDPGVCRADLAAFLSDLLESGIVHQR